MSIDQLRQQFESFKAQVEPLQDRLEANNASTPLAWEALHALDAALEELNAVHEHLREENETLLSTQLVLEAERRRYHDLFQFAPDCYLITDMRGVIRQANKAAAALLFTYQPAMAGKPLVLYVVPEHRPEYFARLTGLATGQDRHQWDMRMHRNDTSLFPAEVTVTRVSDIISGETRLLWLIRDATERERMEDELRESRAQLRQLAHRQVRLQENERSEVARQIHDEAGQWMTTMLLELGVLERDCSGGEVGAHVDRLKNVTATVMQSLHSLAVSLRPATLDKLGLVNAVRQYADEMEAKSGLRISLETMWMDGERLGMEVETTLYRIVQEALSNVARHARASRADVVLHRQPGRVVVVIEDDGIGFDVEKAFEDAPVGLVGMRERCEMLGGRLRIESTPGAGTTVFAQIPMEQG